MKKQKIVNIFLVIILIINLISGLKFDIKADTNGNIISGQCGNNAYYLLDRDTGILTINGTGSLYGWSTGYSNAPWREYSSDINTIVIEYGITEISSEAFYNCTRVTNVIIPESVTEIGYRAFENCWLLDSIKLPKELEKIGQLAFCNCTKITQITIPDEVKDIVTTNAFYGCSSLTNIEVSENNEKYSSLGGILYNKSKSLLLKCPEKFEGVISIPDTVTSIEDNAFKDCILIENLIIPNSVTNIGKNSFEGCETLENIILSSNLEKIGAFAFYYCTSIKELIIPNSVRYIGERAFMGCSEMKSINLSEISHIYEYTCYGCTNLKTVEISNGVKIIGTKAFSQCLSLQELVIPNNVETIETSAFANCTNLKKIVIPQSVNHLYSGIFDNCNEVTIYGYKNSEAENYANNESIPFIDISDVVVPVGSIESTNNVAIEQIVTLNLSDNVEVDGYYWGTNSNYSRNIYTKTSLSSIEKTISESGTYYLTVEDTSGNISDTVSITFYKTILNSNNGNISPSYVITKSGNNFLLPTPTRGGYIFNGWSASSSALSGNVTSLTPTGNATYYATWLYEDNLAPIGTISSTNSVATEQTVTLNLSDNVGVEGYYWGMSSNYLNNIYTATSVNNVTEVISSSGTYYLTVKDTSGNISDTVSVIFYQTTLNANGGSVSPNFVITERGKTFTLPLPTRSEYAFNGWSTSSSALNGNTTSCTPTENATYYATWRNTYSIYYDANYGSGAPAIQEKKTDETIFISTSIPVRSGYTFIGWSTNSNSTVAQYKPGDSYSENADITLYAVWKKEDSSTDFGNKNSGNSTTDSNNQNHGNSSIDFVNQNGNVNSTEKGVQNIVAKSITKAYSKKYFRLKAKSTGDGTLSYRSSNSKIVKVSSSGKVTMRGYGKVIITITASETLKYKMATKKIIITVKPKKAKLSRVTSSSKETIKITWKKDKLATGYVVQISNSKKFRKGVLQRYFTKSQKSISVPFKNKRGKKYYVRVRSYKRVNGVDSYGKWSKTKYVIIK